MSVELSPTKSPASSTGFFRAFVDHPASVNETYIQHAGFAFRFAALLFLASLAALIHALVPPLFETTASRMVGKMNAVIESRKAVDHG